MFHVCSVPLGEYSLLAFDKETQISFVSREIGTTGFVNG